MTRSKKLIGAILVGGVAFASGVLAQPDAKKPPEDTKPSPPPPPDKDKDKDKPAPPPASSGSAAAEVHAGTGYEKHAVVGEAASFPANTKVFVVSVVTGANGTQVKHVWKKDGAEMWTATLSVGSDKWTTSSRRMLTKAGSYEVDVVGADGGELGKVEFTIQ